MQIDLKMICSGELKLGHFRNVGILSNIFQNLIMKRVLNTFISENLGKYSKIKISKFCGYRHEALGPPHPLHVQF